MNRLIPALAGVLLALGGCGVSAEDRPRAIEQPPGPFGGLASATPGLPPAGTAAEPLYFVRGNRLVAVLRRVRAAPTLPEHVQHLIAGPTAPERAAGLTGAVPGNAVLGGVTLAGNRAVVEVGDPGEGAGRSDEVLAYGQIVCTLTARTEVAAVLFVRDGGPLGVPRADGSLSTAPLTAADYAALTLPA